MCDVKLYSFRKIGIEIDIIDLSEFSYRHCRCINNNNNNNNNNNIIKNIYNVPFSNKKNSFFYSKIINQ